MAKGDGQTLEKLYIELGLDLSKLQADLLAADRTVTENLGRLNREKNTIQLRMEADIAGLDRVKDATKILEIQERGLNQQLTLSRDKLAILEAAYKQVAANKNATVQAVQRAEQAFLKEKIAVAQLEQELRQLASQKVSPAPTNNILSGYQNIKGGIKGGLGELANGFNSLRNATSSADNAITAILENIGKIPAPAAVAAAAIVGIPLAIKEMETALLKLAEPAIASGDSMYVMSRGMQLSVADMAKLSMIAKVTGIDINEVNSGLRRFSTQITKAGEKNNLAIQTMKRYGAEIHDANGRLKSGVDLAGELGKALKAAEAEGNGAAFRDIVGGKFWSGDLVTFLEDYADNVEQAKKVVKNGLANPTWAHAIQGEINTLNAQLGQLNSAFSAALMPVVADMVPKMTEQFGALVKVIQANKENIKFLGEVMALPVRLAGELADGFVKLSDAIDAAKDKGTTFGKVFESIGKYRDDVAALMNVAPTTALTAMVNPFSKFGMDAAIAAYRKEIDAFKAEQAKIEADAKAKNDAREARAAETPALNKVTLEQQQKLDNAVATMEERRVQYAREAEDIIFGIRHEGFEKNLRDLQRWEEKQIQTIEDLRKIADETGGDGSVFDDELLSIVELTHAKRLKLEQEKEAQLAEIRQRISAAEKTELENRMIAIEDEKDAWIRAGMEKAEAEQLAQKQLSDYVKNAQKDLSETVQSLYQTDLERRLAQIDKERQAWIDKCADEVNATKLAEQQKADAQRNAAMQVIKQQAEEYDAFQRGGFAGLQAYKMAQLAKSGVNLDYLNMTPQQLQQFQRANQVAEKSLLPNFMTDEDRKMYRDQMTTWQQQMQQRAADYDAQNYAIIDGVKLGLSEAIGGKPIEIDIGKDSKLELSPDASRAVLKDYTTDKDGKIQQTAEHDFAMPTIVDNVTESFSGISPAVQEATVALTELPTAVQGVMEQLSTGTPQFDVTNPFEGFEQDLQVTIQQFDKMNLGVEEVTVKLSDLSAALANFSLPKDKQAQEKTPVNVSVTVQIDEAHAWESEHIQELADKVADVVEPTIIKSIGGDSNSY